MKIDPKHLAAIEVIRREASLTRAAVELGTSQPALSRTLSDLEIRLGTRIFDRRSRPWTLTRLGEVFARQGATVLRAQQQATEGFEHFTVGGLDSLRLAGPPFFTDGAISFWLARFRAAYPNISFELSYGYSDDLRDAIRSGRADVAIYPVGVGDVVGDLTFTPLIDGRNVIACRSGHPILRLAFPRPLALLDYGWVSPPPGSPLALDMSTILADLEMQEAEIVLSGGTLASVMNFVANTDCLTVLPEATVLSLGRVFGLEIVPIAARTPHRPLGLLSRPAPELSHSARAFVDFVHSAFADIGKEDNAR